MDICLGALLTFCIVSLLILVYFSVFYTQRVECRSCKKQVKVDKTVIDTVGGFAERTCLECYNKKHGYNCDNKGLIHEDRNDAVSIMYDDISPSVSNFRIEYTQDVTCRCCGHRQVFEGTCTRTVRTYYKMEGGTGTSIDTNRERAEKCEKCNSTDITMHPVRRDQIKGWTRQ